MRFSFARVAAVMPHHNDLLSICLHPDISSGYLHSLVLLLFSNDCAEAVQSFPSHEPTADKLDILDCVSPPDLRGFGSQSGKNTEIQSVWRTHDQNLQGIEKRNNGQGFLHLYTFDIATLQ